MIVDTTVQLPAHTLWIRLSNIYHDNAETHSSYLDQEFHGLQQGSMTVADYCRKQKILADELNASSTTITDKCLVQNTLCGLRSGLAYIRTLTLEHHPLPSFLDMRSSLPPEELALKPSESSSSTPTTFTTRGISTPPTSRCPTETMPPLRHLYPCRNFQQRGSCQYGV